MDNIGLFKIALVFASLAAIIELSEAIEGNIADGSSGVFIYHPLDKSYENQISGDLVPEVCARISMYKSLRFYSKVLQKVCQKKREEQKVKDLQTKIKNLEATLLQNQDITESSEEVTSPPPTISSLILNTYKKEKSEVVVPEIDDEVQVLQKVRRTKVEIKFSNGIKRGIWILKPPNQVSLTDVQKYLMKIPERYGISAGTIGIFSVKIGENSYHDIHEEDLGTILPLFDGKIVLECWLIKA